MDELVLEAQKGDPVALEALLAKIAPSIHRFGLRMCKSAADADDVLQDSLLSVATHLPEFEGRSSLLSWAFAIARSVCIKRRRGLKNRPPMGDGLDHEQVDRAPTPEEHTSGRELTRILTEALDTLPDEYREAIVLRDIEGLSAAEAAEAVGVSEGALKSRLHRAREALRETLTPWLEKGRDVNDTIQPSPTCPEVGVMWSRMLEGELSQHDCATMEKHIQICAACNAACDVLKKALLACQRSKTTEVSSELQARVKSAVRAWVDSNSAPLLNR